MALMIRCSKHDIGYVAADLYPAWWHEAGIPACPRCRLEWIEEHKHEWDFPVPYETMWANANRAAELLRRFSNPGG